MRSLPVVDEPAVSTPEEPLLFGRGWTRRFVGDANVEEPCAGCAVSLRTFRVLFTRRVE